MGLYQTYGHGMGRRLDDLTIDDITGGRDTSDEAIFAEVMADNPNAAHVPNLPGSHRDNNMMQRQYGDSDADVFAAAFDDAPITRPYAGRRSQWD